MRLDVPAALLLGAACACAACSRPTKSHVDPASTVSTAKRMPSFEVAQEIYSGGLRNGWQDWGYCPHELRTSSPARVRLDNWGAWILARPGLSGRYGGVALRVKGPPGDPDFLQVRLDAGEGSAFPRVNVTAERRATLADGWSQIFVAMTELNPSGLPFDRVVFQAFRQLAGDWILLDGIALTEVPSAAAGVASHDPVGLPPLPLAVDCKGKATRIDPRIYGIAYYASDDTPKQAAQWILGATARRWGGNTTSTYNYQINAWNTGKDWFFENTDTISYADFLRENAEHGVGSALTIPMIGWVSKDSTSASFPVAIFGPQEATDPGRSGAGNGMDPSGKAIAPRSPTLAYTAATPAFVKKWVETIRSDDARTGVRRVHMYILDNEPMIWNSTHRDAHPDPLSYDELVARTIQYGTVVREADPEAVIAGPAEWGWSNYLYSAKDLAVSSLIRLDRRAHGDVPLVAFYLKSLADYEKKTGVRILDVLDLHGYPYDERVGSSAGDADTAAKRIRSTRMLWDPSYVDESWVKEPVKLLVRMRDWVAENYPGRGLSIGEWNFGGEDHMSGGLATAEALGRFGQFGMTSAFYWTHPPESSPSMWAFRAFRNFDGHGAHFLDWSQPTTPGPDVSLFASRDEKGTHLVVVALNLSRDRAVSARIDVSSCGAVTSQQAYSYTGAPSGLALEPPSPPSTSVVRQSLAPYSITVIDLQMTDAAPLAR